MYGVNKQSSYLGLYQLDNVYEPDFILGLGDQDHQMDRQTADHLWQLLKSAIQQIQSKRHSNLDFEELHRYGYYLVLHKYGGMLYNGLQDVIAHHITHKVRSRVLTNLNNNFLRVMNSSWDHHQTSMGMIRDILLYMDRVYVKQNEVDDVYTLGLNLFKDLVVQYNKIQTHLQETLLELVMKERQGEVVDRPAFRSATRMLMVLGNNSPQVYQKNFEEPFLRQSSNFFRLESRHLLEKENASLYLKRAENRINEEIERSESCYDDITKPEIIKVVEDELIKAHMKYIVEMSDSGVVHMMQHQLTEDLACMYKLLGRVSDGLKTMFECISNFLRQQGHALVTDEDCNAIAYVQNLLDLKDKIDYYLINSFSNDKHCKQMIASDFEHILNLNSKSPEYLSLFIDDKLKRNVRGMSDDEREILLDKTMVLFRFLQDKDLFEQYYKQHLAKRLLLSKAVNEENEMGVIAKFKAECGLQYTRKMEGMFRDIWTSSTITEEFHEFTSESKEPVEGVRLSMRVLTAVYWPSHNVPPSCVLPSSPLTAFNTFEKFYLSRHCGRQLTLLPQLGSADIGARFDKDIIKLYTLQVSTYQMCILMLFNNKSQWTFQELFEVTNIQPKDLQRSLQSLMSGRSCQRVLVKQSDSLRIEPSDIFYINPTFSSKTSRIKIPPFQIKYETELERADTIKRVKEDRNHEVEAAIIRVMKARKSMKHDALMTEVVRLLSPRFVPTKEMVKTRVEVLIEREYLARNSEDRRVYEYVA